MCFQTAVLEIPRALPIFSPEIILLVFKSFKIFNLVDLEVLKGYFMKQKISEEGGFEPPKGELPPLADFESAPFVHSGTPPCLNLKFLFFLSR